MSMVLSSRGQKLLLMDFSQESENFFPPVHWWGKHSLGGGGGLLSTNSQLGKNCSSNNCTLL